MTERLREWKGYATGDEVRIYDGGHNKYGEAPVVEGTIKYFVYNMAGEADVIYTDVSGNTCRGSDFTILGKKDKKDKKREKSS